MTDDEAREEIAQLHARVTWLLLEARERDWFPATIYLDRARRGLATADRHIRAGQDPRDGERAPAVPRGIPRFDGPGTI